MISLPKLETACMWNTRWIDNMTNAQNLYDAIDRNGDLNANGLAMKVWGESLLQNLVGTATNSNYIKAFASSDVSNDNLNIFLLNKDHTDITTDLSLQNFSTALNGSISVFTGADVSTKFPSYSVVDTITSIGDILSLTLPHNSVTVLRLHNTTNTLVKNLLSSVTQLTVYPNPAGKEIHFQYSCASAQAITIKLSDLSGKEMYSHSVLSVAGANNYTISKELPKGHYILSIISGNRRSVNFEVR